MDALLQCHDCIQREHREARLNAQHLHRLLLAASVDVRSMVSELQPPREQCGHMVPAADDAAGSSAPRGLLRVETSSIPQALRRSQSVAALLVNDVGGARRQDPESRAAVGTGSEADVRLPRCSSSGAVESLAGAGSRVASLSHLADVAQVRSHEALRST